MNRYIFTVAIISGLVDLMLLLSVGYLTGWKINWIRACAASTVGVAYVGACMLFPASLIDHTFLRICILALMGYITYGFRMGSSRRTALFVLMSMALGAVASGLEGGDFVYLLLSASVLAIICLMGFGGRQDREFIQVSIPNGAKTICVNALVDTGNMLRDPLSGDNVIVVGADVAGKLLGLTEEELRHPLETVVRRVGLRVIPYRTVGQSSSLLLGKAFDGVLVGNKARKCVIAFAPNKIIGTGFNALVGGIA